MADPRIVAEYRFRSALPLTEQDKSLLAQAGLRRRSDDGSGPRLQLGHQPPIQMRTPPPTVTLSNLSPRQNAGGPQMPSYPPPRLPSDPGVRSGGPPMPTYPSSQPTSGHGVGDPGRPLGLVLPTLPQIPLPQIPSSSTLAGGTGQTKPLTPSIVTQTTVTGPAPAPLKSSGLVVGPNTNVADIARHFRDLGRKDDSQSLRLMDRGNGFKELYLHSGKPSGIGGDKQRSAKQYAAYELVKQKVENQLGSPALAGTALAKAGVKERGRDGRDTELTLANVVKLPSRMQGAVAAEDRRMQNKAFANGSVRLGPNSQPKMSDDGAGGALLVRNAGVVLKVEQRDEQAKTAYVGGLVEHVLTEAATPFPFVMPRYESIDLSTNNAERMAVRNALDGIAKDPTASPDKVKKALAQTATLDQDQRVAKFELLGGSTINKLTTQQRVDLFNDPKFAMELGKAAVLLPMLGFDDHMTLDGFGGKVNFANLMLTPDGRIGLIDYDALTIGTAKTGLRFGVTDDNIKNGVAKLVDFAEILASPRKADAALSSVLTKAKQQDYGGNPLVRLMYKVVNEGEDHLLDSVKGVSDKQFKEFAVNVVKGALEGLAYLRENVEAFEGAHQAAQGRDNMHDPAGTFKSVAKTIDHANIPDLQRQLG